MATKKKHKMRSERSYDKKLRNKWAGFNYISAHNSKAPRPVARG